MADYGSVLRRWWWVVLGMTLVGVIAAAAYAQVAAKTYTATASVYVTPTGGAPSNQLANSRTPGAVNLDTEAQIVQSGTVAAIADRTLHSPLTPAALSKKTSVSVPPNSEILQIGCQASSPSAAVACANAFASAYLKNRSATATGQIGTQMRSLQTRVRSEEQTVTALTAKLKSMGRSPKRVNVATQLQLDQSYLHSLTNQQATLTGDAANAAGGYVISKPLTPKSPSSPRKLLVLPGGLAVGLILGLVGAFWLARRDKRIRAAGEVERFLDVPVILNLEGHGLSADNYLASPRSRAGQAFTELAHTVAAALGDGNHILLVAGTAAGPGASVVAANLATTLARTHSEAILVCADMNDTVTPDLLRIGEGPGLTEVASGAALVEDVLRGPADVPGLWVISPGLDAAGLYGLGYDTGKAIMSQLRRHAKYVIIEAQATEEGANAFALAEFADAAVITVELRRTDRIEAAESVQRLRRLRTSILGAVVSPVINANFRTHPRSSGGRVRHSHGDAGHDNPTAHGERELPPLSGTSSGANARRDPNARSHDGHGDSVGRGPGI
jgi:capsular polysaccharide biosynthesis protein